MHRPNPNFLVGVWLTCYATLSWAGTTFAQDVRAYDWESLAWAGAAGLLGGFGKFVLMMASNTNVVLEVPKNWKRGMIVSAIAGLTAYVVVQAGSAFVQTYFSMQGVPRDVRTMILVGSGWAGLRFFGRLGAFTETAVQTLEKKLGADLVPLPPVAAPAESDKK